MASPQCLGYSWVCNVCLYLMHIAQWVLYIVAMLRKNTPLYIKHLPNIFITFHLFLAVVHTLLITEQSTLYTAVSITALDLYVQKSKEGTHSSYRSRLQHQSHYHLLANGTTFHITTRDVHAGKLVLRNSLRHFTFFMHFPAKCRISLIAPLVYVRI